MSDFTTRRRVRTRTPHPCDWCPTEIAVSTMVFRVSQKVDTTFSRFYLHDECFDALQRDPCTGEDDGCIYLHDRGKTCDEMPCEPPLRY